MLYIHGIMYSDFDHYIFKWNVYGVHMDVK